MLRRVTGGLWSFKKTHGLRALQEVCSIQSGELIVPLVRLILGLVRSVRGPRRGGAGGGYYYS